MNTQKNTTGNFRTLQNINSNLDPKRNEKFRITRSIKRQSQGFPLLRSGDTGFLSLTRDGLVRTPKGAPSSHTSTLKSTSNTKGTN